MAKTYVGLANTNKQIKNIYVGKNGENKKIYKAYVGTSNGPRLVFSLGRYVTNTPIFITNTNQSTIYGTKNYSFDTEDGKYSLSGSSQTYYCSSLYSSNFQGEDYDRERVYTEVIKTDTTDDTIKFKVVSDYKEVVDGYQLYEVTSSISLSGWEEGSTISGYLDISYDSDGDIVYENSQGATTEAAYDQKLAFYNPTSDAKVAIQTTVPEKKILYKKLSDDFKYSDHDIVQAGTPINGYEGYDFSEEDGFYGVGAEISLDTDTVKSNGTILGIVYTFSTTGDDSSLCTQHRPMWENGEISWERNTIVAAPTKFFKTRTSNWTTRESSIEYYTVKEYKMGCHQIDGDLPVYQIGQPELLRQESGQQTSLFGYSDFKHDESLGEFEFVGEEQEFNLEDLCDKDIYVYTEINNSSTPQYIVAKKVKDPITTSGEYVEGEVTKKDELSYLYDPASRIKGYTTCQLDTSTGFYQLSGAIEPRVDDLWNDHSKTIYLDFENNDQTVKRWKVVEDYEKDPEGGYNIVPTWETVEDSYVSPTLRYFTGYQSGHVTLNTPIYGRWNVVDGVDLVEEHLDHDEPVVIDLMLPSSDGQRCTHSTATWDSLRDQYHVVVKEGELSRQYYTTYTYKLREYNQKSKETEGSTTYTIETYNIPSEEIQY